MKVFLLKSVLQLHSKLLHSLRGISGSELRDGGLLDDPAWFQEVTNRYIYIYIYMLGRLNLLLQWLIFTVIEFVVLAKSPPIFAPQEEMTDANTSKNCTPFV